MIKNSSINRIIRTTLLLFILFLLYLFPNKKVYNLNPVNTGASNYHDIFLIDNNNYVSKTTISVKSIEKERLAYDLLETLIINGKNKDKIPFGFKAIIPEGTIINSVDVQNNRIIVSFSDKILDSNKDKMLECIIYTLTSISNIKYVELKINGVENDYFEKEYTRSIGINKKNDLFSLHNINDINIYYVSKIDNTNYYIPVTKYINSSDDKIKIIIDELSSNSSYESNLMSYLNYDTKLTNYTIEDDNINLSFNNSILNSNYDNKILEEVKYSISYSIKDCYEVSNVHFYINNKEY